VLNAVLLTIKRQGLRLDAVCVGWFHVECTSFEIDVYIEMAGSDVSMGEFTDPGQVSSGIEFSVCFGRHGEGFHNAL
jgi:hypothetical protein